MTHHDPRLEHDEHGDLAYEGRRLAHQDEPLADQGLQFDITTLLSRRGALGALAAGVGTVGLAACGASGTSAASDSATSRAAASDGGGSASTDGEIPEETNGPYPGDGSNGPNVLTESGIVRSDIRSSFGSGSATAEGVPMTLTLSLTDLSDGNAPYEGVAIYIWHCTAQGEYSMYSTGLEDENYLRGVQIAGADGTVTFTSIFPGCYAGRWPHIHFEVYPDEASITSTENLLATSQVALPQDVCESVYALDAYAGSVQNLAQITLADDNVFGDDGGELQLADTEGDATSGYQVTLPVAIDPTTTPQLNGGMAGGAGGPGGAGAPPSDGGAGAPGQGGGPGGGTPPEGGPGGQAPTDGPGTSGTETTGGAGES